MTQPLAGTATPYLDNIKTIAEQIPTALWAVWLYTERENNKLGKVPHQLTGGKLHPIKSSDATQWGSYAKAVEAFIGGEASGLGLLIGCQTKDKPDASYSSGLVALDIDNCLDDSGELSELVGGDLKQAIRELKGAGVYFEISPSGKGLRALWAGEKPHGVGERWTSFDISGELYDGSSTRFVTVTGQVWKDAQLRIVPIDEALCLSVIEWLGLENHQQTKETKVALSRELPKLTDEEIIQKVKQSAQGKGKRLFAGDTSDYAGDHSSADIALCGLIARWTDDETQLESVWGASGLSKRDKFKRKDYKERTIKEALNSARSEAQRKVKGSKDKADKLKLALEEGDSGGILASALASWGGKVPVTLGAAETILSFDRRLVGAIAYDEFSGQLLKLLSLRSCLGDKVPPDKEPTLGQTWSDSDTSAITVWLERGWGVVFKSSLVDEALGLAARGRRINTVVDKLESLTWDGKPRLASMLIDLFNADTSQDSARYLSTIGKAWMVGTVARAYDPGCKHDQILTMEGGQGYGKSTVIKALASAIAPHTFKEGLPPLSQGQEAEISLQGAWVCELAELSFMDKATTEHIKAFISRREDTFRPKYARHSVTVKRTVSFAGSTNSSQFVRDPSGARRFWVFKISKPIDIAKVESLAEQLWAEAVWAYKRGESWYIKDPAVLLEAEASQSRRLERDWLDEVIADKIIEPLMAGSLGEASDFDMQALALWKLATGLDDNLLSKQGKAFSDALRRVGFENRTSGGRSMWRVSDKLLGLINQAKNN